MKVCSLCNNTYEDWVEFCFADGHPLGAGAGVQEPGLVAAPASPAPPPPASPVASAPSVDPGVPDWDAFDAPEPTLIRMQRLAAQQVGAAPQAIPRVMQPAVGGLVAAAPPSRGSASDAPDPAASGIAAQRAAPAASPEPLPAPRAVPPPRHGLTAVPLEAIEAQPASTAEVLKAEAAQGAAAQDDDFFTTKARESEDDKATVPMYAAQPDLDEPPAPRAARGREDRDDDRGIAAPAAAGIGLAMVAAIGIGAVVLLGGGFFFWKMNQPSGDAPAPTTVQPPQPPPPAAAKPPVEPVAPVEVAPPVEPAEPVEPPPDAALTTTPPETAPTAPTSPSTSKTPPATPPATPTGVTKGPATTKPPTSPATPASGSPWGAVTTAPSTTAPSSSTSSDNPWGATAQQSSGTLRITSEPPGASVYVNDKSYGTTPASVDLPHGKHRVRLSLAGYRTESSDVNLNVGSMSVPFRLTAEEITGIINVFGPTGASVWIDDHDMGPLPVSVQVREGVHALKLIQADGKSCASSRDVRFTSGGRPLAINLQPCG